MHFSERPGPVFVERITNDESLNDFVTDRWNGKTERDEKNGETKADVGLVSR